ncbi:hypothetical protein O6H91_20G006200 [Diphasiastrum complanatum]|uniref:Uncharacterized protein n=1 Tax=Diphasiastrum complanatum TaxID=34168 RepID=A0ACC2AMG2_DIPCM|nr:hypothetical protein O6H91_20G006200 [Diphasiastrum complanatum]
MDRPGQPPFAHHQHHHPFGQQHPVVAPGMQQQFAQQGNHVQTAANQQQFPGGGSGQMGLQQFGGPVPPPAPAAPAAPPFGFGFHAPPPYPFMVPSSGGAPLQAPLPAPQGLGFFNPWEAPPMPAPPPSDTELQKRIDKLVEYAAKNGPQFEALMKEKQKDNPAYAFLFGAEGHNYYRYKLWVTINTHLGTFNSPINPALSQLNAPLHPAALPSLNPSLASLNPPLNPGLASVPIPPTGTFSTLYEQQTPAPPPPPLFEQKPSKGAYDDHISQPLRALRGPLPGDVATELQGVLDNLSGTKESIKGAKTWFMQRSVFAPALAEAMCTRVLATDDVERQLHIIYLVNDILFNSLQQRSNPKELDNEAFAFQPVLGSMLAAVYHNPHAAEANKSRLEKILQFWGSNGVYDTDIINTLEGEMVAGPPPPQFTSALQPSASLSALLPIPPAPSSQVEAVYPGQWQTDQHVSLSTSDQQQDGKLQPSFGGLPTAPQFLTTGTQFNLSAPQLVASSVPTLYPSLASPFLSSLPTSVPAGLPQPTLAQLPTMRAVEHSPYPLFPPGLIPGMVRKMQIGSGVPYSSLSPLDIPTVIPPCSSTESYILERVAKFFNEIGEIDPLEGQHKGVDSTEGEDGDQEERSREGGARIPPPQMLMDPDTGTLPDGSVELRPGVTSTGRLGLGAAADPNEVTQYDDVYTSYRKQRSTNYHTSLSARAAAR